MASAKRILIVGLGALGQSLAKSLSEEGAEVLAIDRDPANVNLVADLVDVAVTGDVTDAKTLEQMGAAKCDIAVVCIGENFEANVISTAALIDLGVKHVAARANNTIAEFILRRIGAHEVFGVETTVGRLLARRLNESSSFHEMEMGGGMRMIQWEPVRETHGKALSELEWPRRFGIQVIGFRKKDGGTDLMFPTATSTLSPETLVLIVGADRNVAKFLQQWRQ